MLPTIVIGADDATREPLLTSWRNATRAGGPGLWFFDHVEEAAFALADELDRAARAGEAQSEGENTMGGDMPLWQQEPDGRWAVNVMWGPDAWGLSLSGRTPELAHTGWTVLVAANVNGDPSRPRRVMDGVAAGAHPDTRIWQAGGVMRPQIIVDVHGLDGAGRPAIAAVVDQLTSRETP